jgi:regulation of enolase protein 1 (concanavalin A-like superfamily)
MKRVMVLVLFIGLVVLVAPVIFAEEEGEEKGNVFVISTYKVQFQNLETMLKAWEENWKPVITKNEYVKSFRAFTHLYGSDWSIVVIMEYEDMAAIDVAWARSEEISKEMFPEGEFKAITTETQAMLLGHTDNIVQEVPSLRK